MALELKSPAFHDGESFPKKYTCQGEDASPPLIWLNVSQQAKSFALICDDPDAPAGVWVHWVIYDIPVESSDLPEGIKNVKILPDNLKQGINDSGDIGYGGPCPPPGKVHRYVFKLYCLDEMLNLSPGLTKQELLSKISGHIIEEAKLTGLYER
ncbi:MAG: YbhB/YbcL family Raf kinase inhibitor-like protein [Candidatus Omnitrophica bacterium]|nr:YbhB/YbcL family Raf kinase inhibitor-like protein [Candidatus Omnitrophota bacterium]MDD5356245.1 YbhB/YbcL family Raf kinase inhibitor-like protein [Candidatus Omnitrophota bacterium]